MQKIKPHVISYEASPLLSTETTSTQSEQQHMLVFHLTQAIGVKRCWHLKEIEQMSRPKHHLEIVLISNRSQPITRFSLSHAWPSAAPRPPAVDFMECLRCCSSLSSAVTYSRNGPRDEYTVGDQQTCGSLQDESVCCSADETLLYQQTDDEWTPAEPGYRQN